LANSSENFKFSSAVAQFAMILRNSEHKGDSSFKLIRELAEASIGEDKYGYRAEFLSLVERVAILEEDQSEASL
jgi:Ca-activated chloride channel homolog